MMKVVRLKTESRRQEAFSLRSSAYSPAFPSVFSLQPMYLIAANSLRSSAYSPVLHERFRKNVEDVGVNRSALFPYPGVMR